MQATQVSKIVGIFDRQTDAVEAVRALLNADFPPSQIALVARNWEGHALGGVRVDLQQAAGNGALFGAIAGGVLGVIVGVLLSLIPGIGFSIWLLAAIGGAAGAAAGCYVGPFIALEKRASESEDDPTIHVQQGRTVVVVRNTSRRDLAQAILMQHGAYDFSMTNQN